MFSREGFGCVGGFEGRLCVFIRGVWVGRPGGFEGQLYFPERGLGG